MCKSNIHRCPTCGHTTKTKTFLITMTVELEDTSAEQLEKEIREDWGFDNPKNVLKSLNVRDFDDIDWSHFEKMGG